MEKLPYNIWLSFIIFFGLALLSLPNEAGADTKLPDKIIAHLNSNFEEWDLAPIREEIRKQFAKSLKPGHTLNYITGDFNGDNSTDYAVYIAIPAIGNQSRKYLNGFVIVLLRAKSGLEQHVINQGNSTTDSSLLLVKAGSEGISDETGEKFTYKLDSIYVGTYEKGFVRYTYRDYKFVVSESW